MAPLASAARLGDQVWPIYRIDLDDVAYYEFTVELGAGRRLVAPSVSRGHDLLVDRKRPGKESGADGGQGFIVVATGAHDFPIPHWSFDRPPPSAQLAAADDGRGAAFERIVKIDSLAYAAESSDGTLLSHIGQMPALLTGLPHDISRMRGSISSLLAEPGRETPDDDRAEGAEHAVKRDGPGPPDLRAVEIDGWPTFRERYTDAFGPFLDDLRRQAAHAWEVESLIEKFGEGIHVGETQRIALLEPEAVVELGGDGARLVKAEIVEEGGNSALVIEVPAGVSVEHEIDLDVSVRYASGVEERLRHFLVSRDTPSNRRASEGGD
jgi:hypothetical protein